MHPFKRAFLIVVFSIGTVGGFASGFAHLGHCAQHHQARRAAFENRVADVCTRSAERVYDERSAAAEPRSHREHDGHRGHHRHADDAARFSE